MYTALIVLSIVFVLALAAGGVLYSRYRQTPNRLWAGRVWSAQDKLEQRRRAANRSIAAANDQRPLDLLKREHLERYLRGQSVDALMSYAGIGPAIVSWLRDGGVTTVYAASRSRVEGIKNIGPGRASDIKSAARQVEADAESKFAAGSCPEAVAYAKARDELERERERQRSAGTRELRAISDEFDFLRERLRIAGEVTFTRFLNHKPIAAITPELMNQPLARPAVEVRVEPAPIPKPAEVVQSKPEIIQTAPAPQVPIPPPAVRVPEPPPEPSEPLPVVRLRAVVSFGYAVAKADGRVAAGEKRQIRVFLERRYAREPEAAARLTAIIDEIEAKIPDLASALWDVRRDLPPEHWPDLNQFAISIADSSGERNAKKVACLSRVAEAFEIGTAKPASPPPKETANGEMTEADCRTALEIGATVPLSVDLIRRQFRLLSERFAPAKFADHGDEFVRMAADKRTRAERAARQLLQAYNEPLETPTAPAPTDLRHNPDLDAIFGV